MNNFANKNRVKEYPIAQKYGRLNAAMVNIRRRVRHATVPEPRIRAVGHASRRDRRLLVEEDFLKNIGKT